MYHPTIFENLKVAFENRVYDLDNLDKKITIINRIDRMDYAVLSREFALQFMLVDQHDVAAEIVLRASLIDLAGEILEVPGGDRGCSLLLRFTKHIQNVNVQCKQIEEALHAIWEDESELTQTLSFIYEHELSKYQDVIELKFKTKINEEQMRDIPDFLHHVLETLEVLNRL